MTENDESNPEVEFMNNDDGTTVAVVDDEAYNLSDREVAVHELDEADLLITEDGVYKVEYDEDGWAIPPEDAPVSVLDELVRRDIRFAEAEAYGFPVEFTVGFRSEDAVFRTSWQQEKLRPSMDAAEKIQQDAFYEAQVTVEVDEDGQIVVTDFDLWPDKQNVKIDI